ncbi:hypothetical protein BC830DRAFT_1108573 [Chytriomyces sp. MP71]|nr:hypothetical protein BC830DRAFT_1108573 [Chytriomyces sp. MP71]
MLIHSLSFPTDARFILESFLDPEPANHCTSHIVIELSSRFDWLIHPKELEEYHHLIWHVATYFPLVHWVASNPLESRVMADKALATPPFRLLRPLGLNRAPAAVVDARQADQVLVRLERGTDLSKIFDEFDVSHQNPPYKRIGYQAPYLNGKTIAKYKAYIEFPCQVSSPWLYESLASGAVVLLPSPHLYAHLKNTFPHYMGAELRRQHRHWQKFHDYYSADIAPMIYYFDSFTHLARLLKSKVIDNRGLRASNPDKFKTLSEHSVRGWADIFHEAGFPVQVDGARHLYGTGPKVYREPLSASVTAPQKKEDWKMEYARQVAAERTIQQNTHFF